MTESPYISVIAPVYNEEGNLIPFHAELKNVLDNLNLTYEIIFVNDGSTDNSSQELKNIKQNSPNVSVITLSRNSGQTIAMGAGVENSKGELIIFMDADMQNDPADIPEMLKKINGGYDIVSGWRKERKDNFLKRTLPSAIANFLISFTTKVKLHDYGCTLKIYKRELLEDVEFIGELHRFLPALASFKGAKLCEIPVNHRKRIRGKSKYGIARTKKVIFDLMVVNFLTNNSFRPIRIFGNLALLLFFIAGVSTIHLAYLKLTIAQDLSRHALTSITVFLYLAGVQLITTGFLGEVLMRVYFNTKKTKIYRIKNEDG